MSATAKAVNYTEEQTAKLIADYAAGIPVEVIAASMAKNVRSIVAKLSREGVYKKKEYVSKTGEKPVSKEQYVSQIANLLNVDADTLGGLEKANKETLRVIFEYMVKA